MTYKHTQVGWAVIFPMAVALVAIYLLDQLYPNLAARPLLVVLAVTLVLAWSLTVSVDEHSIFLSFGPGVIRKHIKLSEVKSVRIVRNRWWCGFGIHGFPGKGWLFNVSGLDAIELSMENGMVYRVGTDEPQKLHEAIESRLKQTKV